MIRKIFFKNRIALLFFIAVFLNGLIWVYLIPIWHTPDEQAHFGQVAFMAEKGRIPGSIDQYDLTEEIYISEKLLGTARDNLGNNRFTFHPTYRIEYSDSIYGKYEKQINALSRTDAKSKFAYTESSHYPVLYYVPAVWLYRFFYEQSLFMRVFAIRFWSLLLYISTIYIVYKLGRLIFIKNRLSFLTLTILVAFQPMFVFSNIGVNSDSLGNFLFTSFIYLSTKFILNPKNIDLLLIVIVTTLSIYTKPQFIIMLPLLVLLILFLYTINQNKYNKRNLIIGTGLGIGSVYLAINLLHWPRTILHYFFSNLNIPNLIRYSIEYTLPHTLKEVLPWYWGIYDWLGVTYPRLVHRIINRILIIALIGLVYSIIKVMRQKLWNKRYVQVYIFHSITMVIFFIALSLFDYLSWNTSKYSLGIQGRYFFPLISIQMLLVLMGIKSLLQSVFKLKIIGTQILAFLMISLNIHALYLVASTYYDTTSIKSFFLQAGQYKPWFVKDGYFEISIILYIIILSIGVLYPIIAFRSNKNGKHF